MGRERKWRASENTSNKVKAKKKKERKQSVGDR
jgi:hypothetical protein